MGKIKVLIKNEQKDIKIPTGIRLLVRRCCHASLLQEGIHADAEVSVTFVNDARIQELNREFRKIDKATDVLSFPLLEPAQLEALKKPGHHDIVAVGDIVISVETAYAQAGNYGHNIQREIGFLTVHSMFHLLGYDHENGGLEAVQMREKEESVLLKLGVPRGSSYVV